MNTRVLEDVRREETAKDFVGPITVDYEYYATLFILAGALTLLLMFVKAKTASELISDPILLFYAIFITTFQLSRIIAALFFKNSYSKVLETVPRHVAESYEPTVSFVVPCKNEEAAIRKTVTKCFEADYPSKKIEVIVINDGSTDRTGEILEEMRPEYSNLKIIHFPENRGKRHGMAVGFAEAAGEIIVQLDSDSYIEPETFRELIRPFANPEIGGVCAHADPENSDENFITKMQTAYYFMSFRILKAAESTYGIVFCLSGCSSAYRKSVVMPHIEGWLNETFLRLPVTWGDDRGLTNVVLRQGYQTIYTDTARARTIVPSTFRQLIKQQIRWKKGWFVNSWFASKFILRRDPFVALAYFFPLTFITILTPFMAARAVFYVPLFKSAATSSFYLLGIMVMTAIIAVFYRFVARENKYWPYLFAWSAINTVILAFLMFYALATIQNRKWGTR